MRFNSLFYILLFILAFVSCETENQVEETVNNTLLKQVFAGGEIYYKYTFNSAGLIAEEKSKLHYTKHLYNNANQLIQSEYYWDKRMVSSSMQVLEEAMKRTEWVTPGNTERESYFSFEYDKSGKLEKRYIYRMNGGGNSYEVFTYDKNGRIEKRTSFYENKISLYDVYFYDGKGNLIKQQRFSVSSGTPNLQTTTEYKFDNKHNPYFSFRKLLIPGQNTNMNNIVKETYTLHFEVDKFIQPVQTTEYSYEYNSKDYPVKRSDGFEYIYDEMAGK